MFELTILTLLAAMDLHFCLDFAGPAIYLDGKMSAKCVIQTFENSAPVFGSSQMIALASLEPSLLQDSKCFAMVTSTTRFTEGFVKGLNEKCWTKFALHEFNFLDFTALRVKSKVLDSGT